MLGSSRRQKAQARLVACSRKHRDIVEDQALTIGSIASALNLYRFLPVHHKVAVESDDSRDVSGFFGQFSYGFTRFAEILLKKQPVYSLQFSAYIRIPRLCLHHLR